MSSENKNENSAGSNLTEMQQYVTQQRGTEPPFSGALLHNKQEGFIIAWFAMLRCFILTVNMIQAAVGRVSMNPCLTMRYVTLKTIHMVCTGLKFVVVTVIHTSDMCFLMALSQPESVIV